MGLRYVFGGAGTGKSHYILIEITKKSKPGNLIFIVPEQFTLESEKQLVALSEGGCIIEPQVLSFNRLAYHIFSKVGRTASKYLDDTGKAMLLRKIIFDLGAELKYFGKVADKQGFMDNLSQTISEFYHYNITVETLDKQIKMLQDKENTLLKIYDLRMIFNGFTEYISEKLVSTEEMLDILSEKISGHTLLEGCEVWIDGFNGFTPQEFKVIAALLKKAERVTVSMMINDDKIMHPGLEAGIGGFFTDPFYEIKKTINKLTGLAVKSGVNIEPPIFMKTAWRYKTFKELGFLQKNFFNNANPRCALQSENIYISRASDKYAEINYAAERIIVLLREESYRYTDIAVLTGALDDYERGVLSIFKQYGIPVFIDTMSDILAHPLSELLRSAVDIVISNRSYESVFRFLKTGLTPIQREDIDYLENYVLAYGIKGYKWDFEDWRFGFEDGQFDKERVTSCRNRLLDIISPFQKAFGSTVSNSGHAVKDITAELLRMLISMNIPETLVNLSDSMDKSGNNEMARRYSQIWDKVMSIFEKMVEIIGDELVNIKQYARILESGLKTMDMGIIPPSMEQVLVGDIERTRLPQIKALFILGANDGILPRVISEQGLLTDEDRVLLISNGAELAPDSRHKSFGENLLIYICLCKPEEKLYISYTTGSLSGKAMQPSNLISKIKSMFPTLKETDASGTNAVSAPKPMFVKTVGELGKRTFAEPGDNEKLSDYNIMYKWFLEKEEYGGILRTIEQLITKGETVKPLRLKSVKKLYGNEIVTSVSRLEKYAACPYAYFLRYNLNAQERKIYEVQPVDIGNFFHLILESFTKHIGTEGIGWRSLNDVIIDEAVDRCVSQLTPVISAEALLSTARYKYLIKRVSRIAKKSIWALAEHIKSGGFEIYATELEFKHRFSKEYTDLDISSGGREIILTGRIDRVDILDSEGKRYVKIIDYKSGGKKFDLRDIYFGMQLQLLLYLDSLVKNGNKIFKDLKKTAEILPGGVFYFSIDDPILNYKPGEDTGSLNKRVLEQFRMSGLALSDYNVIIGYDNNIDKKSSIIPVRVKDGRLLLQASLADAEGFEQLRRIVLEKVASITESIFEGDISVTPYKKESATACDYCAYSSVCRIKYPDNKSSYNIVPKK